MTSKNGQTLGSLLGQQIDLFVDLPVILQRIESACSEIHQQVVAQEVFLQNIARQLEATNQGVEVLCRRQEALEHASRQQTVLTDEHYTRHVLEPFARSILQL